MSAAPATADHEMSFRGIVLLCWLVFIVGFCHAEGLQVWPGNTQDKSALKNGARLFFRHCQACHDPSPSSREQLKALGFSAQQIREEMPGLDDENSRVAAATDSQVLKQAFGVSPPNLTVFMQAQSTDKTLRLDWVYTLLRSYYPDAKAASGWNNTLRPGFVMPNVLQGIPQARSDDLPISPGNKPVWKAPEDEFDKTVSDLVAYLVWMSGTEQKSGSGRPSSAVPNPGCFVLFFLGLLLLVVLALKREYWKDVH